MGQAPNSSSSGQEELTGLRERPKSRLDRPDEDFVTRLGVDGTDKGHLANADGQANEWRPSRLIVAGAFAFLYFLLWVLPRLVREHLPVKHVLEKSV